MHSGGLWGRETTGEVGWALGQSGALSLQGWLQRHGIDGVVMRDGDVREQTPIQSGTSKRGLLGNSGAHHHLCSLGRAREESLGEGGGWGVGRQSDRVHTHQPHCGFIILACDLACDMWPVAPSVYTTYSVCLCKMLGINYFSTLQKSRKQLHGGHACVMLVHHGEGTTNVAGFLIWRAWHFGSEDPSQGLFNISESRVTEMRDWYESVS